MLLLINSHKVIAEAIVGLLLIFYDSKRSNSFLEVFWDSKRNFGFLEVLRLEEGYWFSCFFSRFFDHALRSLKDFENCFFNRIAHIDNRF